MRIQVLPLPQQRVGEVVETPYLLVLSEVKEDQQEKLVRLGDVRELYGARGVLVFEHEVEVG